MRFPPNRRPSGLLIEGFRVSSLVFVSWGLRGVVRGVRGFDPRSKSAGHRETNNYTFSGLRDK